MPPSLRQKSAVRQAQTAMETFYTDDQTYVGANVAALRDIEASLGTGAGTTLAVTGLSLTEYTLDVTSKTQSLLDRQGHHRRRHARLHASVHQGRLPRQPHLVKNLSPAPPRPARGRPARAGCGRPGRRARRA